MNRRRLVQLLVAVAIGVPVAVEVVTFTGLIETELLGRGDDGGDGVTPDDGADEVVGIGDTFLPDSPQTERIASMALEVGDGGNRFSLTIAVQNPSDREYELVVDRVVLDDGTARTEPVAGDVSVAVDGGGSGELEATWPVPGDAGPDRLAVTARTADREYTEEVLLGKVPARRAG